MKYIETYYDQLTNVVGNPDLSGNIYILRGERGLGQHDLLHNYMEYVRNQENFAICLNIRSIPNTFATYSIWSELKKYIDLKYEISYYEEDAIKNDGLSYEEYLLSQIIGISKNHPMYFFCEDIKQCSNDIHDFLKKIINSIFPISRATLVTCLYTDSEDSNDNQSDSMIDYFAQFGSRTRYFNFNLWDNDSLKIFLFNYFNGNIEFLSESTLEILLNSAFGNPTRLTSLVEYLKSEDIISCQNGKFICPEFDSSHLLLKAEKYVLKHYNMLDDQMKELLRSSSIIGQEFDKNLLTQPLNTLLNDYQLKKIEYITHLIHVKVEDVFEFQNQSAHLSIKNIVKPDEYYDWNIALANYFHKKGIEYQQANENIEAINNFIKSGFYYCAAEILNNALQVYLKLIPMMLSILQYRETISIIRLIHKINEKNPVLLKEKDLIELLVIEGDCHYGLFHYPKAARLYEQALGKSIYPIKKISIKRKYAMALYDSGETLRPYDLLSSCLDELERSKQPERHLEIVRVLSFLSSIEETLCNGKHVEHFNQALALAKEKRFFSEYYELLRKALIIHKGKNGIRLMNSALEYNRNCNNKKEYAMCLHNIATEELYHGDLSVAKSYFEQSEEIFKSFGSDGAHYPINALGNYWCIMGKYKKALEYYQESYNDDYEAFSKIGILINQATAHRSLKHYNKARRLLQIAEQLLMGKDAITYSIIKQHVVLSQGLNEFFAGEYENAYDLLMEYFKQETDSGSHRKVIAACCLKELCRISDIPFPEEHTSLLLRTSLTLNRLKPNLLVLVRFSFAE